MINLTDTLRATLPEMPQLILADSLISGIDEANNSGEEPMPIMPITDEEAEILLPGYQIAFEEYHTFRSQGATPDEALKRTLAEWRTLWASTAYVPHRPGRSV